MKRFIYMFMPKNIFHLFVYLGFSLIFLFSMNPAFAAKAVTFRVYSSLPADENSAHYVWFDRFKTNLEERIGNRIKLNYFPNGMLGKEADAAQQARIGAIDIMISGTSIWSTLVPEVGVLDSGYLFTDNEHVGRSLDGKAGTIISALMLEKANVRTLGFGYSLGARNIYTKNSISSPDSLNSMKIRVLPVPNFIATLKGMGAVPIPMPGGEVYSGLQMGVIDGVEHDAPTVFASKYYEIAKYATLSRHIYNPIVITMNKRAFERIPANIKNDVLEAAAEATRYERDQATVMEEKAIAALQAQGVKFVETDRDFFKEKSQHVLVNFTEKYPRTQPIVEYIQSVE